MTTKEIYDLIGSQKDKSNQDLILKTVEDNMDIIDHDIDYNNEETYLFTTMIISIYAEILYSKDRYTKALPFLDKAISLWINNSRFDNINLSNDCYIALVFHRGIANYNKYNIREAKEDFIWLTNYDPENEKYKIWLMGLKNRQIELLYLWIIPIFLGAILVSILLPRDQYTLKNILRWGIINPIFIFSLITAVIITLRKRKINVMRKI